MLDDRDDPKTTAVPWRPFGIGASHSDVIVIGSGFGGAVSAARLAEHGLRVLLLERGPWWGDTSAAPGSRRLPFPRGLRGLRHAVRDVRSARGKRSRCVVLNRGGLLEIHRFQRLTAVTASGVGGGSLIYADVQAQPDPAFFDHFPAEISAAEMHPYYQRVRDTLRPSPLPDRPARTSRSSKRSRPADCRPSSVPSLPLPGRRRMRPGAHDRPVRTCWEASIPASAPWTGPTSLRRSAAEPTCDR